MSDSSEQFFITNTSDLVLLKNRFGLDALHRAMDDPKLPSEIKTVVAFFVIFTTSGIIFNRAVVSEYSTGWKQRRQ
ncbi:hypothetical protein KBD71_05270 [Candidatus Woesebacteria bacterium]|nr:hypothetical protein [Candidatus Woesebacteria bacterium]